MWHYETVEEGEDVNFRKENLRVQFLNFPTFVTVDIINNWLSLKDFANIDNAYTSSKLRGKYLHILRNESFSLTYPNIFRPDFMKFINLRDIQMTSLFLMDYNFDEVGLWKYPISVERVKSIRFVDCYNNSKEFHCVVSNIILSCKHLTSLSIGHNVYCISESLFLDFPLITFVQLQTLRLENVIVSNGTVQHLTKHCKNLTSLDIALTDIHADAHYLLAFISVNTYLRNICVNNCSGDHTSQMGPLILKTISSHLSDTIETVVMYNCSYVTLPVIANVLLKCQHLVKFVCTFGRHYSMVSYSKTMQNNVSTTRLRTKHIITTPEWSRGMEGSPQLESHIAQAVQCYKELVTFYETISATLPLNEIVLDSCDLDNTLLRLITKMHSKHLRLFIIGMNCGNKYTSTALHGLIRLSTYLTHLEVEKVLSGSYLDLEFITCCNPFLRKLYIHEHGQDSKKNLLDCSDVFAILRNNGQLYELFICSSEQDAQKIWLTILKSGIEIKFMYGDLKYNKWNGVNVGW